MEKDSKIEVRILDALQFVAKSLRKDDPFFRDDLPKIKLIAADLLKKHSSHKVQLNAEQYEAILSILEYKPQELEKS